MLDSVGVAMDRKIREENSKVSKASITTSIRKEGDDNQKHPDFSEELRHVKTKEKIEVTAEREPVEEDIIVSSSLNKIFEEHKLMTKLVNEKFVHNPLLKDKIEFNESSEVRQD